MNWKQILNLASQVFGINNLVFIWYLIEIYLFFRMGVEENIALTEVTDENRETFVEVIDKLRTELGTCLGDGLMQGMDVSC